MITIFNRKELLMTYDMKRQGEVRALLRDHGIECHVKICGVTRTAGSRARRGNFGVDLSKAYEYRIYVKRTEYEKARMLIGR